MTSLHLSDLDSLALTPKLQVSLVFTKHSDPPSYSSTELETSGSIGAYMWANMDIICARVAIVFLADDRLFLADGQSLGLKYVQCTST